MFLLQPSTKITEWQKNTVSKYTEFTCYYYHNELMPDVNSGYQLYENKPLVLFLPDKCTS